MKFIAIVIALGVERFWGGVQNLRDLEPFLKYCRGARSWFGESETFDGAYGVILIFLPILLVVGLLQYFLDDGYWVFLGLVFAAIILLASIGPKDLGAEVQAYLEAIEHDDENAAYEHAVKILDEEAVPVVEAERDRKLIKAILMQANDWLLAVVFWFVLLGPLGAVMYRLSYVVKQCCEKDNDRSDFAHASHVLHGILAWIPSRLTGYAFALAGSFPDAIRNRNSAVNRGEGEWFHNNEQILLGAGLGALQLDHEDAAFNNQQVKKTLGLIRRTVIVWLTAIAIITLMGFVD